MKKCFITVIYDTRKNLPSKCFCEAVTLIVRYGQTMTRLLDNPVPLHLHIMRKRRQEWSKVPIGQNYNYELSHFTKVLAKRTLLNFSKLALGDKANLRGSSIVILQKFVFSFRYNDRYQTKLKI